MTDDLESVLQFEATPDGARAAQERHALGQWVEWFLSSEGSDNGLLGAELRSSKSSWCGPVRIRFDDLHRLAGPADQPTLVRLDDDDLETVEEMTESLDEGWEPPPLIVSILDDQLIVEDGNHRIEGLRRSGHTNYWSVVGFDDEEQRRTFFDARRL